MMEFDAAYLGLVTRTVSRLDRDGETARSVILARTYDMSAADLWDAVTNPERLPRWFLPPIAGGLKQGQYQFEEAELAAKRTTKF